MSPEEIRLVRSSWSMIAERADAFTARFYHHLFLIDAGAAQLFNGVDMTIQRWKLAQTLGVVVQALDDLDALLPAVAALGSHAPDLEREALRLSRLSQRDRHGHAYNEGVRTNQEHR